MKSSKNSVSAALSTLASLKPTVQPVHIPTPTTSLSTAPERIFPEPKQERVSLFLLDEDLSHIDKLIDDAKSSGRRKVNQSQAIRALIRSGHLKLEVLDKVLAEDGRRKSK